MITSFLNRPPENVKKIQCERKSLTVERAIYRQTDEHFANAILRIQPYLNAPQHGSTTPAFCYLSLSLDGSIVRK